MACLSVSFGKPNSHGLPLVCTARASMQMRIKWNRLVRVARFHFTNSPNHDSPLNRHTAVLPVEIVPLKTNQLASADSETHRDDAHRAERLHHKSQQVMELFYRQCQWFPHPLR